MACMIVAITAAAGLWYAGINAFAGHWGRANSGLILGAVFMAWFWFGLMIKTARHGVIMAPIIHTPWSEDEPMQIVLERHGQARRFAVRKYSATGGVPNGGGRVTVVAGSGELKWRLVGQCNNSPREHLYTFDHHARTGFPFRAAASWHGATNTGK
jgi:hypothetical protein